MVPRLGAFGISPQRGFLPGGGLLKRLPARFDAWEAALDGQEAQENAQEKAQEKASKPGFTYEREGEITFIVLSCILYLLACLRVA